MLQSPCWVQAVVVSQYNCARSRKTLRLMRTEKKQIFELREPAPDFGQEYKDFVPQPDANFKQHSACAVLTLRAYRMHPAPTPRACRVAWIASAQRAKATNKTTSRQDRSATITQTGQTIHEEVGGTSDLRWRMCPAHEAAPSRATISACTVLRLVYRN